MPKNEPNAAAQNTQQNPNPGQAPQSATTGAQDTAKTPEQRRNAGEVGGEATEIQFFEGTIAKIDKDGNEVMSDHLAPGEKRRSDVDDSYFYRAAPDSDTADKAADKDADKNKQ